MTSLLIQLGAVAGKEGISLAERQVSRNIRGDSPGIEWDAPMLGRVSVRSVNDDDAPFPQGHERSADDGLVELWRGETLLGRIAVTANENGELDWHATEAGRELLGKSMRQLQDEVEKVIWETYTWAIRRLKDVVQTQRPVLKPAEQQPLLDEFRAAQLLVRLHHDPAQGQSMNPSHIFAACALLPNADVDHPSIVQRMLEDGFATSEEQAADILAGAIANGHALADRLRRAQAGPDYQL